MSDAAAAAGGDAPLPIVAQQPIRAVLFDAGLTLIRVATSSADLSGEVLAAAGIATGAVEREAAMSVAEDLVEKRWRRDDWFASERTVRELFVSSYAAGLATLAALSESPDRARRLADRMYDEYQHSRHWRLFPDVLPALGVMERAGVVMGVVSDWGHGLGAILLELGLGRYFGFLVVSSRLGVSKPDPAVFLMALRRISVAPEHALYVGDTYEKDVLGARAAGIRPVLLDREGAAPPVDCDVVRDLTELAVYLGAVDGPLELRASVSERGAKP